MALDLRTEDARHDTGAHGLREESVEAAVVPRIYTRIPPRDAHLRSAQSLDVTRYPQTDVQVHLEHAA